MAIIKLEPLRAQVAETHIYKWTLQISIKYYASLPNNYI